MTDEHQPKDSPSDAHQEFDLAGTVPDTGRQVVPDLNGEFDRAIGPEQPTDTEVAAAANTAGGSVIEDTVQQILVTDGEAQTQTEVEDNRWDIDKARTVGIAARESESVKGEVGRYPDAFRNGNIKKNQDFFASDAYADVRTEKAREELESIKTGITEREAAGEEIPGHVAERLPKAQAEYDTAIAQDEIAKKEHIQMMRSDREKDIKRALMPFERLYDLNPELFAKMPTPEFISITREANGIINRLRDSNEAVKDIGRYTRFLETALARQELPSWRDVEHLIGQIGTNLHMNNEDYEEVEKRFEAAQSGFFDKTPRQIAEGYINIGKDYLAQAEARQEEADRERQEFMNKYKLQDNEEIKAEDKQQTSEPQAT